MDFEGFHTAFLREEGSEFVSPDGFNLSHAEKVSKENLSQWRGAPHLTVDDFVAAKASVFNEMQQVSMSGLQ
jgi:hypothetical protein